MRQATTTNPTTPVQDGLNPQNADSEVLAFRASFEARSPLDKIIREGSRRMLQAAINTAA